MSADSDGNGTLDRDEFRKCLVDADLGFTDELVDFLVVNVDANEDGLTSYTEFAPLCYELLLEVIAKQLKVIDETEASGLTDTMERMAEAQDLLVHGLTQEEVEELIQTVFAELDTDGNAQLDPEEFVNALTLSKLHLSDDEARSLMESIDTDADGKVSLEEFRPVAFQILTEIIADTLPDA